MCAGCLVWCWSAGQGFYLSPKYFYFQVGKPAAFVVNYNGASKGKLRARVVSPSGTEEEALIQEIDDGKTNSVWSSAFCNSLVSSGCFLL